MNTATKYKFQKNTDMVDYLFYAGEEVFISDSGNRNVFKDGDREPTIIITPNALAELIDEGYVTVSDNQLPIK